MHQRCTYTPNIQYSTYKHSDSLVQRSKRRIGHMLLLCSTRPPHQPLLVHTIDVRRVALKPKLSYKGAHISATTSLIDGVSTSKPTLMAESDIPHLPPPPITKSDETFLEEGVSFVWGTKDLDISDLNDLFQRVGFPQREPTKLAKALENTHRSIWIKSSRKSRLAKEGQLLGFARATSDGSLSATIWDVAVAPAWQKGGLGRGMVERLTASLVDEGISTITLYAEPNVVGLYEKLGFVQDPQGIKGLAFQSKSKQGKQLVASLR